MPRDFEELPSQPTVELPDTSSSIDSEIDLNELEIIPGTVTSEALKFARKTFKPF